MVVDPANPPPPPTGDGQPIEPTSAALLVRARARAKAEEAARDAIARMERLETARTDVNAFMEYCFTSSPGVPLRQGKIHKKWHIHIDKCARAGIIAPRDHGKSVQIVVGRVIWEMGKNPSIRIKMVCNDLPKAKKRVRAVRTNIEKNERVKEVFPNLMPDSDNEDWTAATLTVKREVIHIEPTLEARGIITSGTGGRADLIIFDDVCDLNNSVKKPKEREAVKQAYAGDWINLLEPQSRAIYIATPWHPQDLTHHLLATTQWTFIKDVINERYDPVWPEHWSRASLKARADEIGQIEFARGFMCKTVAEEDENYFSEASLTLAKDATLSFAQARAVTATWPKWIGVDLAAGKTTKASKYQVIFVLAVEPATSKRWVLDIVRKREPMSRFMRRLGSLSDTYRPEAVIVENNALQHSVIQMAREHGDMLKDRPVKSVHTGREKMDPSMGIPGLAAEFDSSLWVIPFAGMHRTTCRCNVCLFINECRDGIHAPTTDLMMGAWLATRLIRRKSLGAASITTVPRQPHRSDWDSPKTATDVVRVSHGRSTSHEEGW